MLRRRIIGTVCSVAYSALALVVLPGVAPAATSPAPTSSSSTDPGDYPAQGPFADRHVRHREGRRLSHGDWAWIPQRRSRRPLSDLRPGQPRARIRRTSGQPAAFTLRHGVAHTVIAAHAVAATDGDFSAQVPLTQTGNATITATGEQSHMSVAATVSVVPRDDRGKYEIDEAHAAALEHRVTDTRSRDRRSARRRRCLRAARPVARVVVIR